MDEFHISRDDAKEVANDYLAAYGVLDKSAPQKIPTFLLIAAQPGAGKTGLADASKSYLRERGGYVRIDADRMREALPYYPELARQDPLNASARSQQDAGLCVQELRKLAVEEKRNVMEEGTFRSPDDAERFVLALKNAGNRVELRILAVPPEQSRLGIYQRYEQQIEGGIVPRNVKDAYHDDAVAGLRQTIVRVEGLVDRCTVYNREGDVLHDSLKDKGSCLPVVENVQSTISPHQKAVNAAEWTWIFARTLSRNETGERATAVNRHLVNAHATLRDDPVATQIYDKQATPVMQEMSRGLAEYRGSGAEEINQTIAKMRSMGLSEKSFERVMAGTLEKLAAANVRMRDKSTTARSSDHPPKDRERS